MTAFAQATVETDLGELSCELRSVNHRYLEVAPRMPEELRLHEGALRELVAAKLARGRVDCFIRLKEADNSAMEPNQEAVTKLNNLIEQMQASVPSMQNIGAIDVLRWPGVLQAKQVDPNLMKVKLLQVMEQALDSLIKARAAEGAKMADLIQQRLAGIQNVINEIGDFLPEIAQQYRARLDEKLADIKEQIDPARLEQEMVIFLQKSDVAEELDRLKVHIEEVANVLKKDQPAGRRLDFLMQELNREANTLGSKASDSRLTKASIDLKVYIEQIREQVQNIE